mgnify:CR=1 FL=1
MFHLNIVTLTHISINHFSVISYLKTKILLFNQIGLTYLLNLLRNLKKIREYILKQLIH